nr:unnamed protein product [Digitaria exilis]
MNHTKRSDHNPADRGRPSIGHGKGREGSGTPYECSSVAKDPAKLVAGRKGNQERIETEKGRGKETARRRPGEDVADGAAARPVVAGRKGEQRRERERRPDGKDGRSKRNGEKGSLERDARGVGASPPTNHVCAASFPSLFSHLDGVTDLGLTVPASRPRTKAFFVKEKESPGDAIRLDCAQSWLSSSVKLEKVCWGVATEWLMCARSRAGLDGCGDPRLTGFQSRI